MNITKGKITRARKVVVYGPEGIGKSTFASHFPDPVFIDTEDGTADLDVSRFPAPNSWGDLMQEIGEVKNSEFKTLVIDTIDRAEKLCIEYVCNSHNKKSLEEFGYGSGYVYERDEWMRFLGALDSVIAAGKNVLLVAHAQMRKFEQPDEMGAYDRYELKLGKKTSSQISPLVKEWADALLFVNYKTFVISTNEAGTQHKAQGGKRVMYTSHHACWDAKNRIGLPDEVEFSFDSIAPLFGASAPMSEQVPEAKVNLHRAVMIENAFTPVPNGKSEPQKSEKPKAKKAENKAKAAEPDTKEIEKAVENIEKADKKSEIRSELNRLGYPQELAEKMIAAEITDEELRSTIEAKGYFPYDVPVNRYPAEFVQKVLIAAWDQVSAMCKELNTLPFGDNK